MTCTATLPATSCFATWRWRSEPSCGSYDRVIRYGGDEFLCALPGTGIEGAWRRFDEVARELTEKRPGASVSTGLAALEDTDALDDLTQRADAALYTGRGRVRGRGSEERLRFSRTPPEPDAPSTAAARGPGSTG
jgi:hypothetical protein